MLTLNDDQNNVEVSTHRSEFSFVVIGQRNADFLRFGLARLLDTLAPPGLHEWMPRIPDLPLQRPMVMTIGKVAGKTLQRHTSANPYRKHLIHTRKPDLANELTQFQPGSWRLV